MASNNWTFDDVAEQTAVTSNPAAGVTSVDVKTFTGRGRVSFVSCTCVADANVATRYIAVAKVSGAVSTTLSTGATFVATTTGIVVTAIGYTATQLAGYPALACVDFAPGDILRVVAGNGQAGDDLSAITYSFKQVP